ncbi:MAG: asparaginyl-tRNA synthetase [Limisphaerales bacterium]|jgi:asparaginyl-tRNA synthetase
MDFNYISELESLEGQDIILKGWITFRRDSKGLVFAGLRDGTGFAQCVLSAEELSAEEFVQAQGLALENSVILKGNVVRNERMGENELNVKSLEIIHAGPEYPISRKAHGVEFLMDQRHIWLRSSRQWAMMRLRNHIVYAIHRFFQEKGFMQLDPPLFTANAVEGTTTLFETDFYGQPAYLSQSGQLYGEALALAHGKIYTFGPTFRAEKSKTRRHLSEFWMIEPEMAFYDLDMNMDLIEEFLVFVVQDTLKTCKKELALLERDVSVLEKVQKGFPRITYDDAVLIIKGEKDVDGKFSISTLEEDLAEVKAQIEVNTKDISDRESAIAAGGMKKGAINFNKSKIDQLIATNKDLEEKATNIPQWIESAKNFVPGEDFGGSDETVLTRLYGCPIMVYRWPAAIKAFYMKRDEEFPDYVKGVDVLAPEGYGEIVGGAEREDNLETLIGRIKAHDLPMEAFEWYLDLRRFGSVQHAGFGLGLERLITWVAGTHHIREAIPFPRSYGRLTP